VRRANSKDDHAHDKAKPTYVHVPSSSTNGNAKEAEFAKQASDLPIKINSSDAQKGEKEKPSGLAARRKINGNLGNLNGLQVNTNRSGPIEKGERMSPTQKKITIRAVERFAELYTIGAEVMPSTNTGMEVRHAKRLSDGAAVVIKVRMKANSFVNKDEEQEWRHSTEMILNLPKSENIAQLYEVIEDSHAYYVVMEKVEGMDLFELLDSEGRISIAEARAILRKLLQAVQALHAKGCIHKDLKLENVMVDKSPKSGDQYSPKSSKSSKNRFGMTRGASQATIREDSPEPTVKLIDFDTVEEFSPTTRAKSVVGTDQYIAQEAYAGHYSYASDIFSVGVIAYRLISGRFPFKNQMFDDEPGENWVGSPKMKVIQDRLKHFNIDWTIAPWPSETSARDLVRWMLMVDQKDRPTANEALKHVFLMHTGETPLLPQGPFGSRPRGGGRPSV
jgi:serine/threonine protein kinase